MNPITNQASTNQTSTVLPDEETKDRIKNLAAVGKALFELNSEIGFETDYYVAKEALNKFRDGIKKLELDAESKQGMMSLIEYLHKKIDKRLNASLSGKGLD